MKTYLSAVMLAIMAIWTNIAGAAISTPVTVGPIPIVAPDSENTARALLFRATDYYQGNFGYRTNATADIWFRGNFTMTVDGNITSMDINNTNISIATGQPIRGFPRSALPLYDFYINLDARTTTGHNRAYGGFSANVLLPFQPISIVLRPNEIPQFQPSTNIPLPANINRSNTELVTEDGRKFQYDDVNDGYGIYLNPNAGPVNFEVRDRASQMPLVSGKLVPFQRPVMNQGSLINVSYVDGVTEVIFPTTPQGNWGNWKQLHNLGFDANVVRNGANVAAKVFILDLGTTGGVEIAANSLANGTLIEVRKWALQGAMPVIASGVVRSGNEPNGYLNFHTAENAGKVIVTVIGPANRGDFYISFRQYFGPWAPDGRG